MDGRKTGTEKGASAGADSAPDGFEASPPVAAGLGGIFCHELQGRFRYGGEDAGHEPDRLPATQDARRHALVEQTGDVAEDTLAFDTSGRGDAFGHRELGHRDAEGGFGHAPVEVTIPDMLEALFDRGTRGIALVH